jgi:hypothetical protein
MVSGIIPGSVGGSWPTRPGGGARASQKLQGTRSAYAWPCSSKYSRNSVQALPQPGVDCGRYRESLLVSG